MTIDICLPVFNEEGVIATNISRLVDYCNDQYFDFNWQIVIINNGSTDKTKEIALQLLSDKIKYFEVEKPGRGDALKKYWLQSKSDILVYMDIDMAVSFNHIIDLIDPIIKGEVDFVIGSRRLSSSQCQRSFFRDIFSQIYTILLNKILNYKYSDFQCGFKAIKNDKFRMLSPYLKDRRWFFDTELIIIFSIFYGQVKEVAVDWKENRYKNRKSKVSVLQDSASSFINILKLKKRIKELDRNRQQ